jgi:hypothetical protein
MPSFFVSTGRVPLAAVAAAFGRSLSPRSEAEDDEPSERFAKAIAAMRRTITATAVIRPWKEERLPRRAPP